MRPPYEFVIREATPRDLPLVLAVQHQAFTDVARMHGIDPGDLPPLAETLDDLDALSSEGTRFFVAVSADGAVIGSVRGRLKASTVEVGRLVVDDEWRRCGVATALMNALEASFDQATRFVLFTGADALAPLALYERLGYRRHRTESQGPVILVWLEKEAPRAVE